MKEFRVANFCVVFIAGLSAFVRPVFADDADRYSGTNWAFLDQKQVMAAAAEITAAKYPDCDDALVDCRSERVYRADGTGESQDDVYTKVLTEKGKRGNRTISLGFQIPYNTVSVVKLEILKPDGTVTAVDVAANSKESIDESQMGENIYDPNSKILSVNIPGVEIGDVVHSVCRQTTERAIIPGQYAELNLLESESYIHHTSYEVRAPVERPLLRTELRDPVAGTVNWTVATNAENTIVYNWEVNNVQRMFAEPSMPSRENVLQRTMVTTLPDWPSVSKWYWNLSQPHLAATTAEMTNLVAQLTAGATNELDKAQDLFFYVSKKIRYMGLTPEKDRPGFEPHDVCMTFDKKYGVCRDKAALLVSMLRVAGLPAYPVLINVGTKLDPDAASPDFNHAIVSVEFTNGVYTLMDPTDENTRQLLPVSDCNRSFLVCRPEGETLKTSPIIPAAQNMMFVRTTGSLDNAGTLTAKTKMLFDGVNDNAYREAFAHMKPDDQRRFFERDLQGAMPGAKLTSLKLLPADMLDVSSPVRAELEFTVDGMTATSSSHLINDPSAPAQAEHPASPFTNETDKAIVSLPWVGKSFGIVNFVLQGTGLQKRKYPLETFAACGLNEQISLKLADGFKGAVSVPTSEPVEDNGISYHRTVALNGQELDCTRELDLKQVEFTPAQYLQLKKTLELMQYDDRKSPVMDVAGNIAPESATAASQPAPGPVASNAQILYSQKTLEVKDAHSAVYHVKYAKHILSYNGKIREAEVKVPFNPAIEEAKLIAGVVITKAGVTNLISANEINIMDQGWNAGAKRYTGGKILVANLPGVDIGSTIEVEFEITSHDKPYLAGFESFELPDGMDKKTFDLSAPSSVPVRTLATGAPGAVQANAQTNGETQKFSWQAENVKALPAEQSLPPDWTYVAGVGFFIGDSSAYYRAVNEALVSHSAKSAKAAELARQLTSAAANKLAAIAAIRDYVDQSVRDAGPEFTELPLSELSDADTTLADGYGHDADQAILLHAMLKAAGFSPEFVLASGLPPIAAITNVTAALPLPQNFTSVLVKVAVDGETYYLNDTDQYAHLGATAHEGKLALDPATQTFEVVKASADGASKVNTVYGMSLKDDGTTRVEISRYFYGDDYDSKHRFFAELPPEERRRYFQEAVSGVAQGARPVGGLSTDFTNYPGVEKFTVDIDHYCVVDGKNMYFNLPFTPSLSAPGANQRTLPLFINGEMDNSVRTEITLAPQFQHLVITPSAGQLRLPDGSESAVITETNTAGEIVINHEFKTSPAIVSPQDYPEVLKLESTLGKKSSRVFLMESD